MTKIGFDFFDPQDERRRETLFALGNGVLYSRAARPEPVEDEDHYPGTYCAGVYDRQRSMIAGDQVWTTSLVNLPNWLPLTVRTDDSPWFVFRAEHVRDYSQSLDLARGILVRRFGFSLGPAEIDLVEERLVSMADPHCMQLTWRLLPRGWSGALHVRSALSAEVGNCNVARYAPYTSQHLETVARRTYGRARSGLTVQTRQSGIFVAVETLTECSEPSAWQGPAHEAEGGRERIVQDFTCLAEAGREVEIVKTAALAESCERGEAERTADRALSEVRSRDLPGRHAAAWLELRERASIAVQDEDQQSSLDFQVFHLLQTVSPHTAARDAGLPPRGWQEAYHGQIFWDEILAFPYLNIRFPEIARGLLLYRYNRLDAARLAARDAGYRGAMFPWRSAATGEEETPRHQLNLISGRWMTDHTQLQRHINAAIVHNLWSYVQATADYDFLATHGMEMAVEIARFWTSLARHDRESDRYDIQGVIGPDEYHTSYPDCDEPGLVNNAYTNVMVSWTLSRTCEMIAALPLEDRTAVLNRLGVRQQEIDAWDRVSRRLRLHFLPGGELEQFRGYAGLEELDHEALKRKNPGDRLDWLLEARGDTINRYKVSKQPDVLMLFHLFSRNGVRRLLQRMGYAFTDAQIDGTIDYYLSKVSHESSLSRAVCAGALADSDCQRSWSFFEKALQTDLHSTMTSSTAEGLHLGAMAGTLEVLQRHYLGLTFSDGIHLDPIIPAHLSPTRFDFVFRAERFALEWTGAELVITSRPKNTKPVRIQHSETIELFPGSTARIAVERKS